MFLRIDIRDAVDVLKIQLELVDDEALHLGGTHADVIEVDVDLRGVQRRKDVHPHPVHAQDPAADQRDNQHQGRDRVPHREDDRIHEPSSGRLDPIRPIAALQTRRKDERKSRAQ